MEASENPPATNCHKPDVSGPLRKCKSLRDITLCHAGHHVSGEGGIRTRGTVLPVRRFSKPVLSTTQPPLRRSDTLAPCAASDNWRGTSVRIRIFFLTTPVRDSVFICSHKRARHETGAGTVDPQGRG